MMKVLAFLFLIVLTICFSIFLTGAYPEELEINVFGIFKLKFKNKEKRSKATVIAKKRTPKS